MLILLILLAILAFRRGMAGGIGRRIGLPGRFARAHRLQVAGC